MNSIIPNKKPNVSKDHLVFYGIGINFLGILALLLFAKNANMHFKLPFRIEYSAIISGIFILNFLILLFFLRRDWKKNSYPTFTHTPVTVFFFLFILVVTAEFILIGGYTNRLFGYFSVFFPLLIHLAMLKMPTVHLTRFLKVLLPSVILIISVQSITTTFLIDHVAKNTITENRHNNDTFRNELAQYAKSFDNSKQDEINSIEEREEKEIHDTINQVKNYTYKDYYQIPIGGSNYIATLLIILSSATSLFPFKHRLTNLIILTLSFISIFILQSFGGIIGFVILLICMLTLKRQKIDDYIYKHTNFSFIQTYNNHKRIYKTTLWAIILAFLGVSAYILTSKHFSNILDVLFTGRLRIYKESLQYFTHSPIFGHGFMYDAFANKPHNLFISLLVYTGILGALSYLLLLFATMKFALKTRTIYGKLYVAMVVTTAFHGMIEPNLLNSIADCFFWTISACILTLAAKTADHPLIIETNILDLLKTKKSFRTIKYCGLLGLLVAFLTFTLLPNFTVYTSTATIKVTSIDQEMLTTKINGSYKNLNSEKVTENIGLLASASVQQNRIYLDEINNRYSLAIDPDFPKDKLTYTWDTKKNAFIINYRSRTKADPSIIKNLAEDFQQQIKTDYPFVNTNISSASAQHSSSIKIVALKLALSATSILCWSIVVALFVIAKNNANLLRANNKKEHTQ